MPRGVYAKNTKVSINKSKAEIEGTLERYGAAAFQTGQDKDVGAAWLMFRIEAAVVKIVIQMPEFADFALTDTGMERSGVVQDDHWKKACRQRWRALALLVKAKLESVDAGISTIEKEFLGDLLLSSGQTIAQEMAPQIDAAFKNGEMPKLLLPGL